MKLAASAAAVRANPLAVLAAVFVVSAGALVAGCAPKTEAPPATSAASPSSPAATPVAAPADPATSMAPIAAHGGGLAGEHALSEEGATVATSNLVFDLPGAFRRETPASSMRLAQAVVPGDAGPGELAVFHFGPGQGGGVEANFERWLGQVEQPKGASPERGTFDVNGFAVSWIDARGTLLPSGMGSGPTTPQPGSRLLGAVVEGKGGPWFFKLTGPEATLAPHRDAFLELLHSVRKPGPVA